MDIKVLEVERSTATAHRLSRYDGVCGNVHGHNMVWDLQVEVAMSKSGDDNMPLDLKKVSDMIDDVDHAMVADRDDELIKVVLGDLWDEHTMYSTEPGPNGFVGEYEIPPIGPVFIFDGDPTCEVLSQWMADRIRELDSVEKVTCRVNETDKYGITATSAAKLMD